MVEKKSCGILSFDNIVIGVLFIVLIALIFKYIHMRSSNSEKYKNIEEETEDSDNYVNSNFATEEFRGGQSTCTLFYADWCPHCKLIHPIFNKWRDTNGGVLTLENGNNVMIKSYEEKDIPKEYQKDIEGFPTIVLTSDSGNKIEYNGRRDEDSILRWLVSQIN